MRKEPARTRVRAFLQRVARQHPGQAVRIITGKGLNSPDGPQLRPMVVEELASADGLVAEWVLSPDQGSVLIRLLGENRR
jgi:DNA-nicking Smr family endonuclease